MDVSRALAQIEAIHEQMAKGEVYRGYRSIPVAASGLIGAAAAWLQPEFVGHVDLVGFALYWTAVAGIAAAVGSSEIVYNYVVHDDRAVEVRVELNKDSAKTAGRFIGLQVEVELEQPTKP